jgi:hypothetical protein
MALASLVVATMLLGAIDGWSLQEASRAVPLVRLKPADPEMRRLISDGFDRSATFRALVEAIHRTNGVVIVQYGLCANGRFRSCVTNVDGDRDRRSVRIKVNTRANDDRLIATIAHELHHAIEILSDPDVASPEAVLALYRRIGTGPCRQGLSEACETDAALRVEALVNDELAQRGRR